MKMGLNISLENNRTSGTSESSVRHYRINPARFFHRTSDSSDSTAPGLSATSVQFPGFSEDSTKAMYEYRENGHNLSGYVLPEEVLRIILSKVDVEYIPTCRIVCRTWKYTIDSEIWRHLHPSVLYKQLHSARIYSKLPFSVHYMLLKKKPLNRNLIKNPCGAEEYKFWEVHCAGPDGWAIENPPQGSDAVPVDDVFHGTHCFSTSYTLCSKFQKIELDVAGVAPIIMDSLKPTIYISDWYAARFDCACEYNLRVTLLNENKGILDEFNISRTVDQWQGREWNEVTYEFKDYPEGVRSILFFHSGKDRQFWRGHYGSKMTKSCVKLIL